METHDHDDWPSDHINATTGQLSLKRSTSVQYITLQIQHVLTGCSLFTFCHSTGFSRTGNLVIQNLWEIRELTMLRLIQAGSRDLPLLCGLTLHRCEEKRWSFIATGSQFIYWHVNKTNYCSGAVKCHDMHTNSSWCSGLVSGGHSINAAMQWCFRSSSSSNKRCPYDSSDDDNDDGKSFSTCRCVSINIYMPFLHMHISSVCLLPLQRLHIHVGFGIQSFAWIRNQFVGNRWETCLYSLGCFFDIIHLTFKLCDRVNTAFPSFLMILFELVVNADHLRDEPPVWFCPPLTVRIDLCSMLCLSWNSFRLWSTHHERWSVGPQTWKL
jgi:hypothetical protein